MTKVVLLSFADSKFRPTADRLRKEAEGFGLFDSIDIPSEIDFEKWYSRKYWFRLLQKGMGFWMWKSYVVKKKYEELDDGDILFYIDAGCVLNIRGKHIFEEYIKELEVNNSPVLAFQQNYSEKSYTKADVFHYLNAESAQFTDTGQFYAGCFFIKKCSLGDTFINQWYDICHNHFGLLSDNPSKHNNYKEFIFHRYDQSIFSVLLKLYNPLVHSAKETYANNNKWECLEEYPIHAKRLKLYDNKYKVLYRIKYPLRVVLNFMVVHNFISFHQ